MFFKNEHYLIFPHKFLDGDCIGSAKALKLLIEHSGGTADIMTTEDPSKTKWDYLNVKTLDKLPTKFNACILVDCASPDKTSFPVPLRVPVLVIDHHQELSNYGDTRIIDTTAASTGILIEEIRIEMEVVEATAEYAEAILATIVSDTGGFKHDNTDKKAFSIASSMINFGADLQKVMHNEFNKTPLNEIKVYQRLIPKIEFNENGLVGLTVPHNDVKDLIENSIHPGEFHKFVTLWENFRAFYVLFEQKNGDVKGSLRSKDVDTMDQVASLFGGGGHKKASGFLVPNGNLLEIEQKLKTALNKCLS